MRHPEIRNPNFIMYAVIESGGKQYRVQPGDTIRVERLSNELGEEVAFDRVLLISGDKDTLVGTPHVDGSQVTAEVTAHGRAPKIHVVKFRRRKDSKTRTGHRQHWTEVQIRDIKH